MTKSYSAKDIRVLGEVEHIRLNSGMYIGEASNPVHLIEEALDNALDEALAGSATIVAVLIDTKENKFSVLDNGRGIPITDNVPVVISSKLFSGAKFQDQKSAYTIASGLHGVGLVAVNALSEEYNIEIYRDKKHATFNFKDAKLKFSTIVDHKGEIPFSTKIEFKPSSKYFDTLTPDLDRVRRRLTTASAEMPGKKIFVLYVDDKKEIFNLSTHQYFNMVCLNNKKDHDFPIYELTSTKEPEKFKILFTYELEGSTSQKVVSSVNLLPVERGGNHVNYFFDLLKDFFATKAKKYNYKFQPSDCLIGLRAYLSLALTEPKLSGQTKDALINKKDYFEKFDKDLRNSLEEFSKNEEALTSLLERFQEHRQKLDSKNLVNVNNNGKRASTKFTKLRDCSTRNSELYIVEGDSAAGSILQTRNVKIHAILPLKGKSIPNVTTKKDFLKNREVSELIMALGTGVGPHFNIENLRYEKIICATDADHDGAHIACLVSMVMGILLPDIVKNGKYFIAQTPLFAINEGKTFIPLWTDKQIEKARKDNRKITRFKGLGELSPHQLKICLLDEKTRHFTQIQYSQNIDDLTKLFSSAEEKRNLVTEED